MTKQKLLLKLISLFIFSQITFSQIYEKSLVPNSEEQTITDIDGNTYNTITIGEQTWLKENLKSTKLNDGTPITIITSSSVWASNTGPAYCWYNNNETEFKSPYGALYNWAVINTGKLCPTGWSVPSKSDWETLLDYIGGTTNAGKIKETGTDYWESPNSDATNETGFSAVQAGQRRSTGAYEYHTIENMGGHSQIWSKDIDTDGTNKAWTLRLHPWSEVIIFPLNLDYGASCRCIKNNSNPSSAGPAQMNDQVITIYPNPSKDKVFINIDNHKSNNAIVTISNINGAQVYNVRLESNVIDISNFELGTIAS